MTRRMIAFNCGGYIFIWLYVVIYIWLYVVILWLYVVICGYMWLFGHIWLYVVICGSVIDKSR